VWLQDKLWSDRDAEQGSASLRQCLRRLRASMGKHADCLVTGCGWIGLDPVRVEVRTQAQSRHDAVEFLEGLDIADPEFEDWLRDQRSICSERSRGAMADQDSTRMLRTESPETAGICERDYIGAIVAAAALAGCLMQRRGSPRPVPKGLLKALRDSHVEDPGEIVRALDAILASKGGRSLLERSPH
jgi:hypothetical protein